MKKWILSNFLLHFLQFQSTNDGDPSIDLWQQWIDNFPVCLLATLKTKLQSRRQIKAIEENKKKSHLSSSMNEYYWKLIDEKLKLQNWFNEEKNSIANFKSIINQSINREKQKSLSILITHTQSASKQARQFAEWIIIIFDHRKVNWMNWMQWLIDPI